MLYKYFQYNDQSLTALRETRFWAAHPSKFNDPFDCAFSVDGNLRALYSNYTKSKAICCFSKRVDSILMWSHYANNHTGFCVGFDESCFGGLKELLYDVTYTPDFPELNSDKFKTQTKIEGSIRREENVRLLATKYIDWSYEEEVRIILELNPNEYPTETWDGKLCPIDPEAVKQIYSGCMMPPDNRTIIREIAKHRNAEFFEIEKVDHSFKLTW
jgi:hypothetical protein